MTVWDCKPCEPHGTYGHCGARGSPYFNLKCSDFDTYKICTEILPKQCNYGQLLVFGQDERQKKKNVTLCPKVTEQQCQSTVVFSLVALSFMVRFVSLV